MSHVAPVRLCTCRRTVVARILAVDMRISRIALIALGLWLLGTVRAFAQDAGVICGTVIDPTGAAMPGVTVTLTSTSMAPIETMTNMDGDYAIRRLSQGPFTIAFSMLGFMKTIRPNVMLPTRDFVMRVDQRMQKSAPDAEFAMPPVGASVAYDRPRVTVNITGTYTKDIVESSGRRTLPRPCTVR